MISFALLPLIRSQGATITLPLLFLQAHPGENRIHLFYGVSSRERHPFPSPVSHESIFTLLIVNSFVKQCHAESKERHIATPHPFNPYSLILNLYRQISPFSVSSFAVRRKIAYITCTISTLRVSYLFATIHCSHSGRLFLINSFAKFELDFAA